MCYKVHDEARKKIRKAAEDKKAAEEKKLKAAAAQGATSSNAAAATGMVTPPRLSQQQQAKPRSAPNPQRTGAASSSAGMPPPPTGLHARPHPSFGTTFQMPPPMTQLLSLPQPQPSSSTGETFTEVFEAVFTGSANAAEAVATTLEALHESTSFVPLTFREVYGALTRAMVPNKEAATMAVNAVNTARQWSQSNLERAATGQTITTVTDESSNTGSSSEVKSKKKTDAAATCAEEKKPPPQKKKDDDDEGDDDRPIRRGSSTQGAATKQKYFAPRTGGGATTQTTTPGKSAASGSKQNSSHRQQKAKNLPSTALDDESVPLLTDREGVAEWKAWLKNRSPDFIFARIYDMAKQRVTTHTLPLRIVVARCDLRFAHSDRVARCYSVLSGCRVFERHSSRHPHPRRRPRRHARSHPLRAWR